MARPHGTDAPWPWTLSRSREGQGRTGFAVSTCGEEGLGSRAQLLEYGSRLGTLKGACLGGREPAGKRRGGEQTGSALIDYAKAFDCVDHNKLW